MEGKDGREENEGEYSGYMFERGESKEGKMRKGGRGVKRGRGKKLDL